MIWNEKEIDHDAMCYAHIIGAELNIPTQPPPRIGVILGTGWGDAILKDARRKPLAELPAFAELSDLPGHSRAMSYGKIGDTQVLGLHGRVHMNEHPCDANISRMVRLQVTLMHAIGVRTLVLTCAAGSLRSGTDEPGKIVFVDGFCTLYAQQAMPLLGGEFVSPEDTIDKELLAECANETGCITDGYAYVRGPFFEGRTYDKRILAMSGCGTVGMSMLPEACVAATLLGMKVLPIACVSNNATEKHTHATNVARLKAQSERLGKVLESVIAIVAKSH